MPSELPGDAAVSLAREFAEAVFVSAGMVADLNVWADCGANGMPMPWASLLLTMRPVVDGAFGLKERLWNGRGMLVEWWERWAPIANQALALHGFPATLDHRSHAARGIECEPQNKIGAAAMRRTRTGERMESVEEHAGITGRNAARPGGCAASGGMPGLAAGLVADGRFAEVALVGEDQLHERGQANGDGEFDFCLAAEPPDQAVDGAAGAGEG